MSITDELRKWAQVCGINNYSKVWEIADRIDAEAEDNERFRREAEPFGDRLREASADRADVTLFGVDYVALPLDADGVPIHIGDRVENNERVERIVLTDGSWEPSVYIGKLPNVLHEYFCHEISHHHEPTVEDVLREFADRYLDYEGMPSAGRRGVGEALMDEYAAKLRLAEEADACRE